MNEVGIYLKYVGFHKKQIKYLQVIWTVLMNSTESLNNFDEHLAALEIRYYYSQ